MSRLNNLPKFQQKRPKRVGRGWGSGKGKYAGRGNKGQKSREKTKWLFEGGQAKLQKRLPMIRGKGKNKPGKEKPYILNLAALERDKAIKNNSIIDHRFLSKIARIRKGQQVKLLGQGKLTKTLIIKIPASKKAVKKVQQCHGEYQP